MYSPQLFEMLSQPIHTERIARAEHLRLVSAAVAGYRLCMPRLTTCPMVDWCRAPARLLHILITGSWPLQAGDGETRHFHAGDVILVQDTTGKGHLTSITSEGGVVVARFQLPG
jgi:hypothetical protein